MSEDKFDHIDKTERQELFNQFVAHGGQVVSNKNQTIPSVKGNIQRQQSSSKTSGSIKNSGESEINTENEEILFNKYLESYKVGFFRHFTISFKCYLSKITNLSGNRFTINFRLLTDRSQEYLSTIKDIGHYVLKSKTFQNLEIVESFYNNFPLYYEVMIRINKINLESIYEPLRQSSWADILSVREYFYEMMRQYYCFMLQDALILNSFRKAFQLIVTLGEEDVKVISSKLEILKKALTPFEEVLRKLQVVFPLFCGYDFSPTSTGGKKILGIEGEYMIGGLDFYIKESLSRKHDHEADMKSKADLIANNQEAPDQREELSSNIVDLGARLMKKVNLDQQEIYFADMAYYSKRDKIYIISGLLDFFVRRYSLILSLSKIKFIQTMEKGTRVNIQDAFRDFYIELAKIQRSIKDYTYFMKANESMQDKRLESNGSQNQKNQLNQSIRYQTRNLLFKVLTPLETIVTSIPEYVVDFDAPIMFVERETLGGESYFKGKTPSEAIQEFYAFIKYFVYLLDRGDLAGPSIQIEPNVETFNIKDNVK